MLRTFAVIAACTLAPAALAQTVYKCTVDGKITYGDQPCASGTSVALPVPAAPASPPDASVRERQALAQLERARLARTMQEERDAARARRAAASRYQKCARLRLHRKWAEEDAARATGAAAESARRRARRQAEAMAVECPP